MIELDWGNADETILVWTFHEGWETQNFMDAIAASKRMIANRSHRSIVHILLDIQHSQDLPDDMLTLGRYAIRQAVASRHKGLTIIINPSPLWHHLYKVLQTTIPHTIRILFVNDADEAYEIMQADSSQEFNDK